jgi:Na+(H+)/acetate symporter ActP
MQFFILLLGAFLFVFYQFEQPPVFFNQSAWKAAARNDPAGKLRAVETEFAAVHAEKADLVRSWLAAKHSGNFQAEAEARARAGEAHDRSEALRNDARSVLQTAAPGAQANDADYVFITFVTEHLPHGIIGLLVAAFFAAALSSKAAELTALGSTTTVDFYRHLLRRDASEAHYVSASKWFTLAWGLVALGFALFARMAENLIQAVNIVGSIFYGVVLALFLVAFFIRRVGGTAIFWSALAAQCLVFALYFTLSISYLWYNFIGCAACILFSLILQSALGPRGGQAPADPVTT